MRKCVFSRLSIRNSYTPFLQVQNSWGTKFFCWVWETLAVECHLHSTHASSWRHRSAALTDVWRAKKRPIFYFLHLCRLFPTPLSLHLCHFLHLCRPVIQHRECSGRYSVRGVWCRLLKSVNEVGLNLRWSNPDTQKKRNSLNVYTTWGGEQALAGAMCLFTQELSVSYCMQKLSGIFHLPL